MSVTPNKPNVADTVTVTDSPSIFLPYLTPSGSDAITLTDAPAVRLPILVPTASDTATVTDALTTRLQSNISVSDATTITDSPNLGLQSYLSVADATTVSESINASIQSRISVTDAFTVGETATLSVRISTVVSDGVVVSETITIGIQGAIVVTAANPPTPGGPIVIGPDFDDELQQRLGEHVPTLLQTTPVAVHAGGGGSSDLIPALTRRLDTGDTYIGTVRTPTGGKSGPTLGLGRRLNG